mmetsp:Transcript_5486/g.16655  ORF Transcript_5486/g.16655 Transcript_5486/m.16655 type:complete len:435 (+) Transcript_5486:877-2181(+)
MTALAVRLHNRPSLHTYSSLPQSPRRACTSGSICASGRLLQAASAQHAAGSGCGCGPRRIWNHHMQSCMPCWLAHSEAKNEACCCCCARQAAGAGPPCCCLHPGSPRCTAPASTAPAGCTVCGAGCRRHLGERQSAWSATLRDRHVCACVHVRWPWRCAVADACARASAHRLSHTCCGPCLQQHLPLHAPVASFLAHTGRGRGVCQEGDGLCCCHECSNAVSLRRQLPCVPPAPAHLPHAAVRRARVPCACGRCRRGAAAAGTRASGVCSVLPLLLASARVAIPPCCCCVGRRHPGKCAQTARAFPGGGGGHTCAWVRRAWRWRRTRPSRVRSSNSRPHHSLDTPFPGHTLFCTAAREVLKHHLLGALSLGSAVRNGSPSSAVYHLSSLGLLSGRRLQAKAAGGIASLLRHAWSRVWCLGVSAVYPRLVARELH